jgi:hypothetical protein
VESLATGVEGYSKKVLQTLWSVEGGWREGEEEGFFRGEDTVAGRGVGLEL